MPQFLIPKNSVQDGRAELRGDEAHHARDVFRMKAGDVIQLFDGEGSGFTGRITALTKEAIEIAVESRVTEPPPPPFILVQSILPRDAMDWVVEKATELGVTEIVPAVAERCVARTGKKEHWEKIALAACKQSGRLWLPKVREEAPLSAIAGEKALFESAFLFHGSRESLPLKYLFNSGPQKKFASAWIGPEGGFSPAEIELMKNAGARLAGLGSATLRSETAAIAAITLLRFLVYP